MTAVDLDAIEARLKAATPGPWVAHDCSDAGFNSENEKGWWWVWRQEALPYWGGIMEPEAHPPNCVVGQCQITDGRDGEQERHDAEFIAHAPADIAAMAAELRELRAKVAALASALERTEWNFRLSVQGRPVRDMAETLAENRAALADLEEIE